MATRHTASGIIAAAVGLGIFPFYSGFNFQISDVPGAVRTTGAIILMISHGYSVNEHDDSFVDVVEGAINGFSECLEPGAFLVDMMPFCKLCSLPGALLGMLTTCCSLTNSAICTRLVSWNRMEGESEAVREIGGRYGGYPSSAGKGSDGESRLVQRVCRVQCIDVIHRRLLGRRFLRSRRSCSTAMRSLPRLSI